MTLNKVTKNFEDWKKHTWHFQLKSLAHFSDYSFTISTNDFRQGDILLYVREDIPSNLRKVDVSPIESFYVELNLRNTK